MPVLHAIVLGVVQGLAEFLPISSSGHLLIVPWLFEWDDFAGNASLEKTFDVALHLGTLIGVLIYFRADVVRFVRAGFSRRVDLADDRRMAWLIVLASVPAAITGAIFNDFIDEELGRIWLIGIMLIVFGVLLWLADRLHGQRPAAELGVRDALLMGAGQALALSPGVSRSGVTMTVGRGIGFDRDAAARLSFLMSMPITAGALLYEGAETAAEGFPDGFAAAFAWGIVASALTGYLAVWGILYLVRTRSFAPFVVYRIALGVLVLGLSASSVR